MFIIKNIIFKFNNSRLFSHVSNTIDSKEIQRFQRYTAEWWDQFGPTKALHSMNKLRVPFVRDGLINTGAIKRENINCPQPLKDVAILDIGCGGGILSEPLARLGSTVTGLDANYNVIETARSHCKQENLNIKYDVSSIEDHATENVEKYDVIVASEIIEHVTHKDEFIKACIKCLKPSGSIFITTLSKTTIANILAIQLAEYVFNLVPKGTHEIDKFIKPHELQRILEDNGCRTELIHGMFYNFMTNTWYWFPDTSINYALHATKLR